MSILSLHFRLYSLREDLAPFRETGAQLNKAQVSFICRVLAVCAADAEQLAAMLGQASPVLIDPADDKVVCIARYRRRRPDQPRDGGDAA